MADTFVNVTWVADELVTSTKLNQAMANQSNFHNGTALGDGIIVTRHIAADAIRMLDKVIFSGARLKKSAHQSVANATIVQAAYDQEDFDTDSYHSDPTRIIVPVAGKYFFNAIVSIANNGSGNRYAWLGKNGNNTTNRWGQLAQTAVNGDITHMNLTAVLELEANDYVELNVFQNSGVALNLLGDNTQPGFSEFSVVRLGS